MALRLRYLRSRNSYQAAHESEAEARHLAGGNAAVGDDMSGDSSGGARLGADDA
eukprot:CAMPEP_0184090556 /NCGR_PEP_ID=MMETSP0974-20121125/7290_1 /TAXON_ID=483370 /ORGANISM="non described non described, Strain CCMP2097" /LENGTH=53 /DNA_ID=CAMNT_0026393281 /DNA_START=60 /DNA_END=218 /DNA_ORIENTATION=+